MQELRTPEELLGDNAYPGRGLVLGRDQSGRFAVAAYFIMGRSANSRNRIFVPKGDDLQIRPWDESKVEDPSLIVYRPLRVAGDQVIVSNGDQTDTIFEGLGHGRSFEDSLDTRCYEPDAPHYTPRISGLLQLPAGNARLSILKRDAGEACLRACWRFSPAPGQGRLLHTYAGDGSPLPSFAGEPRLIALEGDLDQLTERLWQALDPDNRVSLVVRFIRLPDGGWQQRIVNKNQ